MRWSSARTRLAERPPLGLDNANRADGSLTASTSGATWTIVQGTFTTSGNRILDNGTASAIAALPTTPAVSSFCVSADLVLNPPGAAIGARYTVGGDYYMVTVLANSTLTLYRRVTTSTLVSIGTYTTTPVAVGDNLALSCKGSAIRVSVNGAVRISVTDTSVATGTNAMLRSMIANGAHGYDNVRLTPT